MNSYQIYKSRHSRQAVASRNRELILQDDINKFREIARRAQAEAENLKFNLFGNSKIAHRTVRKTDAIEDRGCGEIPPVSIRFARRGFINNDWRNQSLYDCYIVMPKDAVFTRGQAAAMFNEIVDVLKFATKGGSATQP